MKSATFYCVSAILACATAQGGETPGPKGGDAGTASDHACHESLLRHYYSPFLAEFAPGYHESRPVISTNLDPTSTIVVPAPDLAGYYLYQEDGNIQYFAKPAVTLRRQAPGFYKVLVGRQAVYVAENGHEEFEGASMLPRTLAGDKDYRPLKPGKAVATAAGAAVIRNEILKLLKAECAHYKTDIEDPDANEADKVRSREHLTNTLYTCARVVDSRISSAATQQAVSCGISGVAPGSENAIGRSQKIDDDNSAGPKPGPTKADSTESNSEKFDGKTSVNKN